MKTIQELESLAKSCGANGFHIGMGPPSENRKGWYVNAWNQHRTLVEAHGPDLPTTLVNLAKKLKPSQSDDDLLGDL